MKNKERMMNDVGIDHGCDSKAFQPCFLFFLLNFGPWGPFTAAFSRLFVAKQGI